jgi:hypothetical protein
VNSTWRRSGRAESDEARFLRIRRRHSGAGRMCCDWCLLVERIQQLEEHRTEAERIILALEEERRP